MQYYKVSSTNGDIRRELVKGHLRSDPWVVQNILPSALKLYKADKRGDLSYISTLPGQTSSEIRHDVFQEGDELIVHFMDEKVLGSYTMRGHMKNILVGDVTVQSRGETSRYFVHVAELPYLNIYNLLPYDVDVHFGGSHVGVIRQADGLKWHSGSQSIFHFDNERRGIKRGEKITFMYQDGTLEVTVLDNHASELYIGMIHGYHPGSQDSRDNRSYSLDKHIKTDVTYFVPQSSHVAPLHGRYTHGPQVGMPLPKQYDQRYVSKDHHFTHMTSY